MPAPNTIAGADIVPGAAAAWPSAAPMLMVPVEPALSATWMLPVLLTAPPLATVSVPVAVPPPMPGKVPLGSGGALSRTIRLLVVQGEPAPVTSTVPTLLAPTFEVSSAPTPVCIRLPGVAEEKPMMPAPLVTVAPADTVRLPVPNSPTASVVGACKVDPAPLTEMVSTGLPPPSGSTPMLTVGAETCPPLVIFTMPLLATAPKPGWEYPTFNDVRLVHFDPAPSTTTVLVKPLEKSLTNPAPLMTWPPCWITRPVMLAGLSTKSWLVASVAPPTSSAAFHSDPAPVTATVPVAALLPLKLDGLKPPIAPPSL